MFRVRGLRAGAGERPAVLSLWVRAAQNDPQRVRSQFEVLVRHLYDRLLNSEAFGEDAATRVAQLTYAIALPGVLIALFLFPAYHGLPPHPLERSFWSQACDHLFYVTYAFVIMGGAVIFQWEMLFPDALDVSVMETLPISLPRLLLGRATAMAVFLTLVQVGTSGLGSLFLPAVADQRCGFFRHFFAHAIAVSVGALCVAAALIVLQGVLVSLPRSRGAEAARSLARVLSLTTLLTILFLFPLVAHSLQQLLRVGTGAGLDAGARLRSGAALGSSLGVARWYPPFWFLGIYECAMWGSHAPEVFHALARTGGLVTAVLVACGAVLYPLGYLRRVRQLIEGSGIERARGGGRLRVLRSGLHRSLLTTPQARATAYFAAQTLLRTERLHLYLAMYAGVGVALVLSGLLVFRLEGAAVRLGFSPDGLRIAVPIVAFWTVAGLKTALLSPLGRQGSWVFRVVGGTPGPPELRGARVLVGGIALVLTLATIAVLHAMAPAGARGGLFVAAEVATGIGLSLLLTELFFTGVRSIPFTVTLWRSVHELPWTLVRYFVAFPALALFSANSQAWMSSSIRRLLVGTLVLAALYLLARSVRIWTNRRPAPQDELLFVGLRIGED